MLRYASVVSPTAGAHTVHSSVMRISFLKFKSAHGYTWVHCFVHPLAKPSRICAWPLTLRNPPEPSWTSPNLPDLCTCHLLEHSETFWNPLKPSETFLRNLPPEPAQARIGIQNLPLEPASGTCTSTRRKPPEPAPAHTGTLRNPPQASGTCACDPQELIWAEDPMSLSWLLGDKRKNKLRLYPRQLDSSLQSHRCHCTQSTVIALKHIVPHQIFAPEPSKSPP